MKEDKNIFPKKLKAFLHDPIDKCLDIKDHENRARKYAEKLGISDIEEAVGPDHIASCMERSLLPKEKVYQDFNEIRHPLSEKEIKISISENNKKEIFQITENVFESIGEKVSSLNDKQKFLYLWRNLQEELIEKSKGQSWRKYLSVLPADTRIPDHSIWEHLKITSAVNAWFDKETDLLIQNNSLFLFTIGPVQFFISQARKTQDFYMGSFILSFLTFKAMEVLIEKFGPTNIIYPDLYRQPLMDWWMQKNLKIAVKEYKESDLQLPTIPNRFVALIPENDCGEIKNLANEMKKKIKETINSAKDIIFKELKINQQFTKEINEKINSQLSEFPEIYWVALPWKIKGRDVSYDDLKVLFEEKIIKRHKELWDFANESIEKDGKKEPKNVECFPNVGLLYELLYSALEKLMGARKNLRLFKQYEKGMEEKGRKCSVCGERDVVFFWESKNKIKFTSFNTIAVDLTESIDPKFLSDGEGLCAICFLKRTFELYLKKEISESVFDKLTFPSTAEIACADWKEKAILQAKDEFRRYVEKLKESLKNKFLKVEPLPKPKEKFKDIENPDGQYFYEENITQRYFEKELGISLSVDEIKQLKEHLKALYNKIDKPKSYYAIIHLDVDNMGKWLSGEFLPNIQYAYNSETWTKMSEEFKKKLNEILSRKLLTPAIHASISTALRNYALEFVRKIVEEDHLGKLVYAGGDDVLAFVNLKDLFEVMDKLRWALSGNIKIENGRIIVNSEKGYLIESSGFVEKDEKFILTMGPKATASAGVVIAHYKTPLQIVIRKVFEMEKKAKENGKDAFAICLMKRSGEEREIVAKWSYDENNKKINTIELINELVNAFDENNKDKDNKEGYIAKGFIQKLESEFVRMKNDKGVFIGTGAIFDVELKRLLDRSYNGSKEKKKDFIERNYQIMKKLFWKTGGNIDNFLNICRLATFISKAED